MTTQSLRWNLTTVYVKILLSLANSDSAIDVCELDNHGLAVV